jgi:3-oxoacyl-[acyl-carrier-protein] synthase II
MDRKEVRRSDLYTQYAMAASVQAMTDAGLAEGGYDPESTGVIIGSGIGGIGDVRGAARRSTSRSGPNRISPFFVPMFIGDIAAGVVSMRFNAQGAQLRHQSACATSAHAIGMRSG